MSPIQAPERQLLASWETNAAAWTSAVRGKAIASRELGTDRAILEAVAAQPPRAALDLGCGEGWLVRALTQRGILAFGVDGSASLIEAARRADQAVHAERYRCLHYEQLEPAALADAGPFELAIANFALLGEDIETPLRALAKLLVQPRRVLIQTLHPANIDAPERDGWRHEDFRGFGDAHAWAPMPWYFRTLASWTVELAGAGFTVERVSTPLNPGTGRPLSLLIDARG
ncbi:class I SAM-dependent methyltransferase [Enhygromyxa salina]|uniref:Uncharacterized protein n=1 Tax=Enhygromyxa salina TaxID=215803 RepID=A0A2S9YDI1_9BACT|nr:class I SAM-dependent methyltransferase [Enhygromyxa salina]PRQ03177.1 hypothetical protein ENSA7_53170 [Enhygromyxa salina]